MKIKQPLVSIITPTYNSSLFINETYKCICYQKYSNWEWLVTDDCSTDNTFKILCKISLKDNRVKIDKNEENLGAAKTRNKSLQKVTGDFVAFLDADDLWRPEKLEEQIKFMGENIDFSFTAYEIINKNGKSLNRFVDLRNTGSFNYDDMLRKKATLGCSTVLIRKSSFEDMLMPILRTGQDYALWLKLLKTGKKAHILNKPLTKYRIVPNSISRNKIKKAFRQWYIYKKVEHLSTIRCLECFFWYSFRALVK